MISVSEFGSKICGPDEELENHISTISLLIDDLSSEDPNAKLHSLQRLKAIA